VDRHSLALMIPILALMIPVAAVVMGGMIKLRRMRLEEARYRMGDLGVDPGEVVELREDLDHVRAELAEVQERLDFAERLLARPREIERENTPH